MIAYLKDRFDERSSWVQLATGLATAVVIPEPWCYLVFAFVVIGVLVPDHD